MSASAPIGKSTAVAGTGPVAPEILWAQRSSEHEPEKNVIMLTINVPNLPPVPATKLDLTETGFEFHAKTGDEEKGIPSKEWAFKLEFFAEIDPKESKVSQTSKSLYLVLRKKEAQAEYWPRLSKEKVRMHNVKTDFAKWRDEDEQDDLEDLGAEGMGGMGGMDPAMMGGMGGGMGGMDPSMLGGMGGMGGGMGGMDLQSMLANMGGGAGGEMPDFGDDNGGDDDGDDDGPDGDDEPAAAAEGEAAPAAAAATETAEASEAK